MVLSISAVVLLGLLIAFLIKIRYLRWTDFLLSAVFGFLIASTAAAPVVQGALDDISGFLSQLRF